ncbi:MAG: nitrite/sulfite reductase [Gammaproteobacteria bacterium]|nr:nitrite/sulfite reductase [Gammaproteobacteria bacterium]
MDSRWNLTEPTELDRFEETVNTFLRGELDPERFTAFRLQQGVYGQRQTGVHMVRIKLPGGRITRQQLIAVAEVTEKYANHKIAHISTRQDIQLHYVPTENTPALLRHLAGYELTTREACGNTVRNITACPMAGVCPREHVDITTHLEGTVKRFLRHPLTQHLPRKFKMSFSGCESDCAQAMMHDLGVVAVKQDGKFGLKVLAGGGLGHKPHEAIVVEPFLSEQDLLPCIEAVIALHHRYSDRKRRAKARIKFLVDKFGKEGFLEKYREEFARTKSAFEHQDYPKGDWKTGTDGPVCGAGAPRKVIAQKQKGLFVFPIAAPIGDLTPEQLRGIAALMEREGLDEIRATQDQNLMILNVPEATIPRLRAGLKPLALGEPQIGDDVVACPGTSTCKLGITSSKIVGQLVNGGPLDLRVRVSGCHNSCAQPDTGDIGLYGEGRRLFGKLIPHYVLQLGGNGMAGGAFTFDGPEIPATRVVEAVQRIKDKFQTARSANETFFSWSRRMGADYFETLLVDLAKVEEADVPSLLSDHGEQGAFKVLQLGGGECGGANQEQVSAFFFEAAYERDCRNNFAIEHKYHEALECLEAILRLTAKSVLHVTTRKIVDAELSVLPNLMQEAVPDRPDLASTLQAALIGLDTFRAHSEVDTYTLAAAQIDNWMRLSATFCESLDPLLDLSTSVPREMDRARVIPIAPAPSARIA